MTLLYLFIHIGTESGEISDDTANGEADDAFDFTAPVRSFLEKSRHYFSGTQEAVESSFAEKNVKKKGNAEGIVCFGRFGLLIPSSFVS